MLQSAAAGWQTSDEGKWMGADGKVGILEKAHMPGLMPGELATGYVVMKECMQVYVVTKGCMGT